MQYIFIAICAMLQVAIKFEHETSKGCSSNGRPTEWAIYSQIGDCHGIPKIYAKGTKDNFYIMVARCRLSPIA